MLFRVRAHTFHVCAHVSDDHEHMISHPLAVSDGLGVCDDPCANGLVSPLHDDRSDGERLGAIPLARCPADIVKGLPNKLFPWGGC